MNSQRTCRAVLALACLIAAPWAWPQVSDSYDATWWATTSGGGLASSGAYSIHGAAGQTAIQASSSASAVALSGYIAGDGLGVQFYALTVILAPQAARDLGAQWTIDGGATWYDSGDAPMLPAAEYLVEAATVPGWVAPSAETVLLNADSEITLTYTPE
ncbi:MAG: hypothetical protein IT368_02850, partial [Candidatus Hydrogenedentes bacterium]|nr:hypothetical protein [Candidatus Hydrogenedentota bacterium]